ncbi:MAG: biotin-dependent carboxyltransferase family protein [Kangiellaceae bacterium]|nr:biotin-dependent carboxyltransferase family protein [Kangiellaceae bacterium]
MSMRLIYSGLQTSVQDAGRFGYMHIGISRSGAMDHRSMELANWLLGNPLQNPVLEVTLIGPIIEFEESLSISITGARFELFLNGQLVFNNEVIQVNAGDILEFERLEEGARAYIAFSGQLDIEVTLNSYSTHLTCQFGGHENHQLKDNDRIKIRNIKIVPLNSLDNSQHPYFSGNYLLRCVNSVETSKFSEEQILQFYQQKFYVSPDSNRMGIRLLGTPLEMSSSIEILSSGLTEGTIQIPPSGLPIVSSVDGQTIGGYPRIANVIATDLPLLGQLKANDKINFTLVNLDYSDKLFKQAQDYKL